MSTCVSELASIDKAVQKKLMDADIASLEDLVRLHTSPKECLSVSAATGISLDDLRHIVNLALFSQIDGVDNTYAAILVKIGVDTIKRLSGTKAESLLFKMAEFNESQPMVHLLPSLTTIERWISDATAITNTDRSMGAL